MGVDLVAELKGGERGVHNVLHLLEAFAWDENWRRRQLYLWTWEAQRRPQHSLLFYALVRSPHRLSEDEISRFNTFTLQRGLNAACLAAEYELHNLVERSIFLWWRVQVNECFGGPIDDVQCLVYQNTESLWFDSSLFVIKCFAQELLRTISLVLEEVPCHEWVGLHDKFVVWINLESNALQDCDCPC